jgi:catechol 2,3-dioxygenase-like lactoylglutathione lyase family enzyme
MNGTEVELKLEVVIIPVSDVDRAKRFYGSLGWRLDADFAFDNGFRVVQFTPLGSGCSIQFGTNITSAAPGTRRGPPCAASGRPRSSRSPRDRTQRRVQTRRPAGARTSS